MCTFLLVVCLHGTTYMYIQCMIWPFRLLLLFIKSVCVHVHVANVRRKASMSKKVVHPMDGSLPKLRGRGMASPVNFTNPLSGKRLGLFDRPKPGTRIMPPAKPSLDEVSSLQTFTGYLSKEVYRECAKLGL